MMVPGVERKAEAAVLAEAGVRLRGLCLDSCARGLGSRDRGGRYWPGIVAWQGVGAV